MSINRCKQHKKKKGAISFLKKVHTTCMVLLKGLSLTDKNSGF